MDLFKSATKQKVRFATSKGVLSTEQLWELSLVELDSLAVGLEKEVEEGGKKSFLHKTTAKNKLAKLKFDVVLEVLNTKLEEENEAKEAKANKEHNAKILAALEEIEDKSLKSKSAEELRAMLK